MIVNGGNLVAKYPILNMACQKLYANGVSYGLSEVGYDIRLKQKVTFFPMVQEEAILLEDEDGTNINHGRFTLASAMEEFNMPTDLMGIVHDKSTWARCGLSVFNTVIEPGWRGFLTLELVYHGKSKLVLPAGVGIAQVVFHQIEQPARYEGKYQDQANRPVDSIR